MHGQRAPPPSAATTPEVDIGRKQRLRSESGLPGWMRSVTQCGRPSGGRKPPFNNTDQTYATNHDELHSRDDDDFDDASSVSTTVSSEMNADLLDTPTASATPTFPHLPERTSSSYAVCHYCPHGTALHYDGLQLYYLPKRILSSLCQFHKHTQPD